ncbi:MAG: DUF1854 domain-containing protein [Burkholderiaceae bacterium]|nr:DUF1854 domain-containing protein [Sulfuritalea sp.]MCF8175868.1 DUF1854 domain-containing protein [Burkholderiaceae bacterium]MCF8184353.1 DUF1854 domain-containing protein [Polynucleobacter sp.]
MNPPDYQISRNAFGHLVLTRAGGERHENVVPIRAFPIAAPGEGVSLVGQDGEELAWIERLDDLDKRTRDAIEEDLALREFVPVIARLKRVSTFATPSTWLVDTDRGETSFVLRGEEDIRHLGQNALLISDSHGIQYLIADLPALDKHSRRLLDRFL